MFTESASLPLEEEGGYEPNYLVVIFAPEINGTAKLSFLPDARALTESCATRISYPFPWGMI